MGAIFEQRHEWMVASYVDASTDRSEFLVARPEVEGSVGDEVVEHSLKLLQRAVATLSTRAGGASYLDDVAKEAFEELNSVARYSGQMHETGVGVVIWIVGASALDQFVKRQHTVAGREYGPAESVSVRFVHRICDGSPEGELLGICEQPVVGDLRSV